MPKLTLHEIYLAQQRIEPYITRTPLMVQFAQHAAGCEVWLKAGESQGTLDHSSRAEREQNLDAERRRT